ncbi:MAG: metallopeptidase family protein [Phycisphaerales bacterium]|nr:metallopeptidase family protein [Phycisphaerales bacterium]
MNDPDRTRFDRLLDDALPQLPASIRSMLEQLQLIVDDVPEQSLLDQIDIDDPTDLCGLHTGIPLTERSVEDAPTLPTSIHLFREGILKMAGGWEPWTDDDGEPMGGDDIVQEEIVITLLHELGHHFGLDEQDLERLGYA